MSMRRFVAPTARDCLRRVKEELGPDAVVVSNKPVDGGIEIMAMTSEGFEILSRQAPPRESASAAPRRVAEPSPPASAAVIQAARQAYASGQILDTPSSAERGKLAPSRARVQTAAVIEDDYTVHLSGQVRKSVPPSRPVETAPRPAAPAVHAALQSASISASAHTPSPVSGTVAQNNEPSRLRPLPGRAPAVGGAPVVNAGERRPVSSHEEMAERAAPALTSSAKPKAALPQDEGVRTQVHQLMGEMHTIKALLERQLAGFAWGEISRESPVRAQILAEMLDAGFSGQLSRKLCQELPTDLNVDEANKWMKMTLNRHLRTLGNDNDIIDRGGIYALVGPTGVGKTTTTAKLAARCVVRYGADKIALLTTDGYRIGAHEQLRIYGRILGVPVHVVRDGDDLRHTLADLRDKHMVLIDTVGMSQRDRMVAEQAAMLVRAGEVNRLLLLNATSRGDTLDDVVSAYAGEDLAGVILSKVDETASVAPALDAVIRHGLLLCYVANGQRVPEDMHLPNRNYLLHRAFRQSEEASPHRLRKEEAGLVMPTLDEVRKVAGGLRV